MKSQKHLFGGVVCLIILSIFSENLKSQNNFSKLSANNQETLDQNHSTPKDIVKDHIKQLHINPYPMKSEKDHPQGVIDSLSFPNSMQLLHQKSDKVLNKAEKIAANPINETNINVEKNIQLTAYPTVVYESFHVNFQLNEDRNILLQLLNSAGDPVLILFEGLVKGGEEQTMMIGTDDMSYGFYFVHLLTDRGEVAVDEIIVVE